MENVLIREQHCETAESLNHDEVVADGDNGTIGQIRTYAHRKGGTVLQIVGEQCEWVSLHSAYDPAKEAETFCSQVSCNPGDIIVLLGAGSGHYLASLRRRYPGASLILVERSPKIIDHLNATMPVKDWRRSAPLHIVCSQSPQSAVDQILALQRQLGWKQLRIITHPASMRTFPGFYIPVQKKIESVARVNIAAKLRYPKFKTNAVKVLILQSKYYLLAEMIQGLRSLGHAVNTILINSERGSVGTQDVFENIISEIVSFQPDFILTVNHLGFDREGILTQFLSDIELPYASWYVDSPLFILKNFNQQQSPYLSIFVWDRDYIPDLHKRGFEHVFYLPLATDLSLFYQKNRNAAHEAGKYDLGFVGNSGDQILAECRAELPKKEGIEQLLEKLAVQFWESRERNLADVQFALDADEQNLLCEVMQSDPEHFEPAVTWRATQLYRHACIHELAAFSPELHGDAGWKRYLSKQFSVGPELNYYDELPDFYNRCRINFNTTSLQMKNSVNQRVFDVPACKAFLLTDYREQIEDLFRVGTEVICYKNTGEISGLVAFYLRNDSIRNRIVAGAYRRVAKDHTYRLRLERMIARMRSLYA